jgi:hypothetical protein
MTENIKPKYSWTKEYRIKIRQCTNLVCINNPTKYPEKDVILEFISKMPMSHKSLTEFNYIVLKKWNENRAYKIGSFLSKFCIEQYKKRVTFLVRRLKSIPNTIEYIDDKVDILKKILKLLLKNITHRNLNFEADEEPFSEKDELFNYVENDKNIKNEEDDDDDSYITKQNRRLTLTEAVYRYYRYFKKITLMDSVININDLIEGKVPLVEEKCNLITSYEQNQKTFLALAVIIVHLAAGYTPVCGSKDVNQKNQFLGRIKKELHDVKKYLIENHKFSNKSLEIFDNALYFDSKNPYTDNSLEESLSGEKRRIIKFIKEHTQVKRILENMSIDSKVLLLLDEAHLTGGYKLMNYIEKNVDEEYHESDEDSKKFVKYDSLISELKNKSTKYFLVTATSQDILMSEKDLYSDNITFIPPTNNYRGIINACKFKHIDTKKKDYLNDLLDDFKEKQPIVRYDYKNNRSDLHSNTLILKAASTIEEQEKIFYDRIKKDDKTTYVLFTGTTGCVMYHQNLGNESITIAGFKSFVKNKIHYFDSNCDIIISDVLQFLADRGLEKHPNICIINYHLCCEGMSYTSYWDRPQNWHATSIVLDLSDNITASNARQVASRIFGAHGDDIILHCYCTPKLQEKIIKAYELHDKQVKAVCGLSGKENVRVRDYLSEIEYFNNHIPTKYHTVKDITEYKNIVINENRKEENKIFKEEGRVIKNVYKICPEKYKEVIKNISKYEKKARLNKEEFKNDIIKQREKLKKTKINIEKDDKKEGSYKIKKPTAGIKLITYNKVIEYLKDKNIWIRQSEIRKYSGINDTREMNDLRGRDENKHEFGTDGLLWRKNGREYEYILY